VELTRAERQIDYVGIVGTRTDEPGIGSESACLFGQLRSIFDISYSDAGLKDENSEGVTVWWWYRGGLA